MIYRTPSPPAPTPATAPPRLFPLRPTTDAFARRVGWSLGVFVIVVGAWQPAHDLGGAVYCAIGALAVAVAYFWPSAWLAHRRAARMTRAVAKMTKQLSRG